MWNNIIESSFNRGFLYGAGVVVAVMLLLWMLDLLVKLLRRRRRCHKLVVSGDDGEVILCDSAIVSTIKIFSKDFPALVIRKIKLYQRGGGFILSVQSDFIMESGLSLTTVSQAFRSRVLLGLADSLGVDKNIDLELNIRTVKSDGSSPNRAKSSNENEVDEEEITS